MSTVPSITIVYSCKESHFLSSSCFIVLDRLDLIDEDYTDSTKVLFARLYASSFWLTPCFTDAFSEKLYRIPSGSADKASLSKTIYPVVSSVFEITMSL